MQNPGRTNIKGNAKFLYRMLVLSAMTGFELEIIERWCYELAEHEEWIPYGAALRIQDLWMLQDKELIDEAKSYRSRRYTQY